MELNGTRPALYAHPDYQEPRSEYSQNGALRIALSARFPVSATQLVWLGKKPIILTLLDKKIAKNPSVW